MAQQQGIAPRLGHTLVELVTAMVASAALLAGLGSVMMIARQVAYTPSASAKRLEASEAFNELADDARFATFFITHTSNVLEFVVSDRNGDGSAERIRYEWSGVPGAPLQKTVNGGTPVALVDSVQDFQLSYILDAQTTTLATTTDTAAALLASNTSVSNTTDRDINALSFWSQRINPTTFAVAAPANVLYWNVTRVDFYGRKTAVASETLRVQIRSSGDPYDNPTGEMLGEVVIPESSLPASDNWNTATFSTPVRGLALHRMYALVFRGTTGEAGDAARLVISNSGSTWVHPSSDAGASWQYQSSGQTFYRLYGTYTSPGTSIDVTRNFATRVNVVLQGGTAAHSRINASVPLANTPELLSAYWRTDFDSDPTAADVTRDGVADWSMASGSFNGATLVNGIWQASGALESRPKNNFTTNTIVDVRCRNTSVGGNGAVVQIHADRQGGTHAPLVVRVQRQADLSQTLTLYGKSNDATDVSLFQRKNLSSDFVGYRLTILPASNVVNLTINDEDQGTFSYPTYAPTGDDRFLTYYANTSSAEFDYVELRVAE